MKVTFTESIDAKIVVTARLSAEGEFYGQVAAICEYADGELDGATCSAHVELPSEIAQQVRAAMEAARAKVMSELGSALSRSKSLAYKTSVEHKEIAA